MSSPVFLPDLDEPSRKAAIDPARSFTVRAPAGSGKTELLIQRFLGLLAVVQKPESIVAITFTRKAAGEMLDRILGALREARKNDPIPDDKPHVRVTRDLALRALQRDQERGWDLLQHPGRLRVQTIDSLCMSITGEMPWLARLGAVPRIEEDARTLYAEGARRTLLEENGEYSEALATLLRHLDNNAAHARDLIATMLARRDQWLDLAVRMDDAEERAALEEALARSICRGLAAVDHLTPRDLRQPWMELARYASGNLDGALVSLHEWPALEPEQMDTWKGLIQIVLTSGSSWRKRLDKNCGFPPGSAAQKDRCADLIAALQQREGLLEALNHLRKLPSPRYTDAQWAVLRALLRSLRLAVAQLRMVFREQRVIDFIELGIAAREALGRVDNPTELAYRLDSRIEHLLVDEFQDTSRSQFDLLMKLTAGWQPGDGRTLFLVGDPMQSIYRFRQAEVGLFLEVEERGLGDLPLEPLQLVLNRRSRKSIVEEVNRLFANTFPGQNNQETGAVTYTPARAADPEEGGGVTVDGFLEGEDDREAECVIRRIHEAREMDPQGSVAILVRARTHLPAIIEALKAAGIRFRARDIDPLEERTIVRDLLALTCAMLHPMDRIAWLAILRAPWCGLTLADLEALVHKRAQQTIWECLHDLRRLSDDGQSRAARLRNTLGEAFAEQGRWSLRRWVERAWMKLGGPACLEGDEAALQDAATYFERLENEQSGSDLRDFEHFRARLAGLFAQPDGSNGTWLEVMTIHKAKGLEFDTVILPGLGRPDKVDEDPLVVFHEWRENGNQECLLAPIDETGAEEDPLYSYLTRIERDKTDLERTRQFYVAATRAKKWLHLLGQASLDKNGEAKPRSRSMLALLWPALTEEQRACFKRDQADAAHAPARPTESVLRRLPESWSLPELPAWVEWEGTGRLPSEPHEPSFEWVGESLRHAGTVVHAFLQRMRDGKLPSPDLPTIRKALAHVGVTPSEIESTAERVRQALARIQTSTRGRWILGAHQEAQSEYAVTGVVEGEVVRGLVDRTFVDDGVRWIIDFKTSAHEGGNIKRFLDEQQRRYRDQMERYARILTPLGRPVRLGLYFPLLDEWREWAPESA